MATAHQAAEFHCWYAPDRDEALRKGRFIYEKFRPFFRPGRIIELGCGEGALLLWLIENGMLDVVGVDSNEELCELARSFGVTVVQCDLLEFLRSNRPKPGMYLYIDVIEHVPFEYNIELLKLIPVGSRLLLQTPYTQSVLGHQYYMNVPSHLAPYSPWVIKKMLARCGYQLVADGSVEGEHAPTWKNKLREVFIWKVLGISPELLHGGGNYYAVADRVMEAPSF
jgi:SAM-dependent methyltransferase